MSASSGEGSRLLDRALWITWYDLPENGRDRYLEWLDTAYIPRMMERRGFLWAAHYRTEEKPVRTAKQGGRQRRYPPAGSVPGGYQYVLIFGADDASVFAAPTPKQVHAGLPAADRDLLAMRTGDAMSIMLEQARIDGPESGRREPGQALSPCIQLGSFVFDGDEQDLLAWYTQWRLPSMTSLPGCIGVRKLVSVSGWARHAILHEFVSVEARNEHFVDHEARRHPEQARWSEEITGQVIHYPGSPNVARRIFSAVNAA
jgi:hypothetical protein